MKERSHEGEEERKMELTKKKDNLIDMLVNNRADVQEETLCENFAYRRSLLFYANDCKYCRYACKVKTGNGRNCDYICTFAMQTECSGK